MHPQMIVMERKRIIHIVALFLSFLFSGFCYAWPPAKNYELTKDGVIIYPDSNLSGHARAVRLQVISNKIIRITASATKTIPEVPSLITVYKDLKKNYAVTSSNGNVVVKTPDVTATIVSSTGAVSFTDKYGKPVLMERSYNGRSILPAIFDGEASYNLSQTFVTAPGEAYYGLGQHQSDQFNYKGQQVFLFQNNNKVAVPFLPSVVNLSLPVFSPVCSRIVHLKLCG